MAANKLVESNAVPDVAEALFPPFDPSIILSQVFWIGLCFGVLYLVMARFGLPKVAQIIDERAETIRRDQEKAAQFNEQAHETLKAYETLVENSRAEARSVLKQRRDEAQARLDANVTSREASLKKQLDETMARLDAERARAVEEAKQASIDLAHEIYDRVIAQPVDNKTLEQAVTARFN